MATNYDPITIACANCSHEWETRAGIGSSPRCPNCKKTRRIKTSDRTTVVDSEWDESSEPIDDSQSNILCSECNTPLHWTAGRSSLECRACGNLQVSPTAIDRGIDAAARERKETAESIIVVDTGPKSRTSEELMQGINFAANRAILVTKIYELTERFNPNGLPDEVHDYALSFYAELHAMADTTKSVVDSTELDHMANAFRLRENQLRYYANEADEARIANNSSIGPRVIQGKLTPRAIESASISAPIEYDDDDDEYDDAPYIREFTPNTANFPWGPFLITIAGIAACFYAAKIYNDWLDGEIPILCNSKHALKNPVATLKFFAVNPYTQIAIPGTEIHVCEKHGSKGESDINGLGYDQIVFDRGNFSESRRHRKERKQAERNSDDTTGYYPTSA